MSNLTHKIYIGIMAIMVAFTFVALSYYGYDYYRTSIEERFYQADHNILKPSGIIGHGLGIVGTLLMIIGVSTYMARKRFRSWSRIGKLKYWLEFHIFLCTLGPIMVLFHTSFKFGGIVSISFWSMVAVFLSGVIGRFIYIQIPRSIEGRELSLAEIQGMKEDIGGVLKNEFTLNDESYKTIVESTKRNPDLNGSKPLSNFFSKYIQNRKNIHKVKSALKKSSLSKKQYREVLHLVKNEISINNKISRLQTMVNLFKYWHVAHLPFALVMLVIMVIHVAVTIVFGYRWIF